MRQEQALKKEARKAAQEIVALPPSVRGKVQIRGEIPPEYAKLVERGREILAAYVHPGLLPKPLTVERGTGTRAKAGRGGMKLVPTSTAKTFVHEGLHLVEESHPEVLAACQEFLRSRTQGETPEPLDVLTGNADYKGEYAYKDRWKELGGDHYCGKIDTGSTEILTMGLPRLHRDPARFAREDPEYFSFVVNTLRMWK